MFRSLQMYRVELVVPEHDIVVVTEALATAGVFHMSEYLGAVGDGGALQTANWDKRANAYISLVQRIADVMELLAVEAGPPPKESLHLISSEVAEKDVELAEAEARVRRRSSWRPGEGSIGCARFASSLACSRG